MSMVIVLAQELSVLRDRTDAIERVAARHGIDLAGEIETLVLDQAALDARELRRQQLLERLYYLARKEANELEQADSKQRYDAVIDETAQA
jgi:parvulin-like peptidyl-prolyl isomerase